MDLYILYELLDFKTMLIDSDRLDEETAKTLLEGLCKNIILAGIYSIYNQEDLQMNFQILVHRIYS